MPKLGIHVILDSPAALEWSRRAPVVKAFDGAGRHMPILQAAQPGAIVVFRHWWGSQPFDFHSIGGQTAAAAVINALHGFRNPNLYLEALNEQDQDLGHGDLPGHVAWLKDFTDYAHGRGYKVAGFGFSTGNPIDNPDGPMEQQIGTWDYLMTHDYAGVDAVSMHEYWGNQGFSTWNALRYRRIHRWTEGDHPAFLITECGRDLVEGGLGGWRRDGISAHQYIQEIAGYEAEIEQDDYVLGATPFTAGPTPDWERFSTDGLDTNQFSGLPPRTIWTPEGVTPMPDNYIIDAETRAYIVSIGWTPAGSYDDTPESCGFVVCLEGIVYYLNGPAVFRAVPFG